MSILFSAALCFGALRGKQWGKKWSRLSLTNVSDLSINNKMLIARQGLEPTDDYLVTLHDIWMQGGLGSLCILPWGGGVTPINKDHWLRTEFPESSLHLGTQRLMMAAKHSCWLSHETAFFFSTWHHGRHSNTVKNYLRYIRMRAMLNSLVDVEILTSEWACANRQIGSF